MKLSRAIALSVVCLCIAVITPISAGTKQSSNTAKCEPSSQPPAGLKPAQVPQFVVFGFDDNGYSGLEGSGGQGGLVFVADLVNSRKNPAGKANPATYDGARCLASFYVVGQKSVDNEFEEPKFVRQMWNKIYKDGNEIAVHSYSHGHGVEIDWDKEPAVRKDVYKVTDWTKEIDKCIEVLVKPFDPSGKNVGAGIGITRADLIGYRTPFLEYNDDGFIAMQKAGFSYDCSIEEGWQENQDGTNNFWPYTLDHGSPGDQQQSKNVFSLKTPVVKNHPGLWEFACYAAIIPPDNLCEKYGVPTGLRKKINKVRDYMSVEDGKVTGLDWNMWFDFGMTKEEFVATWKYTLDLRLSGNRAPFTFGAHSDIYSDKYDKNDLEGAECHSTAEQRRQALKEIVDYALSKSDVRIVSMKQLLDWVRNPRSL
ncbi:MAG: hypothetical protein JW795_04830 [Chitinivibrionales bacterium]|nr:hypothetical protein [Chitinivibrionales bacterium]